MTTEAIGGTTSIRLSSFYNLNQSNLNDTMVRISSGKRFQSPGINAADYFHAAAMKNDVNGLQQVDREIVGAIGMVKVAAQAGQSVFDDVARMKELVGQYYNTSDTTEKAAFTAEFNAIKNRVAENIRDSNYDGKRLIADSGATPLRQVVLDPRDVTQTLNISFSAGDVVDVSGLTIGGAGGQAAEQNAVDAEALKSGSFLAKTTGYLDSLNTFYDMNSKKEVTCAKNAEDTENIDGIKESADLTKRQIAQQMTVSMMAQANMVRSSVLSLLGIK